MSAVAGVWRLDSSRDAILECRAVLDSLSAYGPDRQVFCEDGPIAMGSCLTRLLPEDRFDRQPLTLERGAGWLVADARIDNRDDLARELGLAPPDAAAMADSEFIGRAWERWGEDCVRHLLGAFAFAVWQPQQQRLFAARDATGERPLFFYRDRNRFAFATMPKGLLALPNLSFDFDEELLGDYLALLPIPPERYFIRQIEPLPHGHCIAVTAAGVQVREYWHPRNTPRLRLRSDADYVEAFRETFDKAVACRLRTTGNIGSELSGGLDSSSVTATAARLLAARGQPLQSFTHVPRSGYRGPEIPGRFADEGPYAAQVAALYPNIEHILVPNGGLGLLPVVRAHVARDDQPVFNPTNMIWLDSILHSARERKVTAILTGRMGNGTISYGGFHALSGFLRRGQWLKLARYSLALRRNGFATLREVGGVTVLPLLPLWLQRRLTTRIGEFNLDYCALHPDYAAAMRVTDRAHAAFNSLAFDVPSEMDLYFQLSDCGNEHAGDMAGWGIEMRDPTHDKRILAFVYSLPPEQFLRGGQTRSLIRRAMSGRLPEDTLTRSAYGMQAADWHLSMQEALPEISREIERLEQSPTARRLIDLPRLKKLASTWPGDGFHTHAVQEPYHYALGRALGLGSYILHFEPRMQPAALVR